MYKYYTFTIGDFSPTKNTELRNFDVKNGFSTKFQYFFNYFGKKQRKIYENCGKNYNFSKDFEP